MASIAYSTDKKNIERGDIFYVESVYNEEGSEQKSGRPAIIVSNDKGNGHAPLVTVVYLTTAPKNYLPTHVTIRSSNRISTALCEQVTTVSKTRLGSYMSTCTDYEMEQIGMAIEIALGLEPIETIKEVVIEKPIEVAAPPDNSALVKAMAERDLFERMYQDVLAKLIEKMN